MLELIKYVVGIFAENSDATTFDVCEEDNNVKVTVTLDKNDMGKVIGRQGKIAKALRVLVKAGAKDGKKYSVEIVERGEME